jgi:hypothetical protein
VATVLATPGPGEWVLLAYRLPREPSGPRTTLWRRLKRLGVAQLVAARAAEYRQLAAACTTAVAADQPERARALRRLRSEWRAINRRDFFPPSEREVATVALRELAAAAAADSASVVAEGAS